MEHSMQLELTRKMVEEYVDESEQWMAEHLNAMECRDCEDFLVLGLKAYRWLSVCDETFREADARGLHNYSPQLFDTITGLYRAWLAPCGKAELWIARVGELGHTPDNLDDFRAACEAVAAIVEDREWSASTRTAFDQSSLE